MQRVLFIHNEYQIRGGEDTVVDNEVALLRAHGHEVIEYRRSNLEYKDAGKLGMFSVAKNTIFNRKVYKEILALIREKHVDVVHVHNTFNVISPSVYYAAKKAGVPVVQTIHNFRFFCINALMYRDGKPCELCANRALKPGIQHKCYHDSKLQSMLCAYTLWHHRRKGIYSYPKYIALTDFGKEKFCQAMKDYVKPEQVTVLPNFVADEREEAEKLLQDLPTKDSAEQKSVGEKIENWHLKRNEYYVCVSRLDATKGVKLLVEQWPAGEKYPLVICGDGPLREELTAYISERGYLPGENKHIWLLGNVPHDQALAYIKGAKALIFPSLLYEGFPMTIAEAAMLGTPVIANDIGNGAALVRQMSPDTVIRLADGFTQTANETEGATKSTSILDRDLKSEYGDIYRKWYEEHITADAHYDALMRIYDNQ